MECVLENITVHYEVCGDGKPIIILPGWGLNTRFTAHEAEPYFQGRGGWKRIYIDPPGHGKTSGENWVTNLDKILGVLLACVDQLTAGQRYSLIGYSLGAYLARGILFNRTESVNGIALIIPGIITDDKRRDVPPHKVLIEEAGIREEITPAETFVYDMAVVHTRKWLEYQRSYPVVPEGEMGDSEFLNKIREDPQKYAFSFDMDNLTEPFPGPALIAASRQDAIVGYRDAWNILEKYPRATYVVFDRAGHELEDKQELLRVLVNDWLDRVEESIKQN